MKRLLWLLPLLAGAQFHRAEQDREIRYWLLEPETHQFKISHDFTITRVGQKSAHSFVRKGSTVNADAQMYNLDTGEALPTKNVSGKSVNELGYYPTPTEDDSVVVQGDLKRGGRGRGDGADPVRRELHGRGRVLRARWRAGVVADARTAAQLRDAAGGVDADESE
jgi:hypothetical protein